MAPVFGRFSLVERLYTYTFFIVRAAYVSVGVVDLGGSTWFDSLNVLIHNCTERGK